ncbi:MAG: hypothetical protein ACRDQY_05005 [Pseudonocardiaceae bacterium]
MQLAGEDGTFLSAAQQGMFAIDTVVAGQMKTSIEQIQEVLEQRLKRIGQLKTQAMLGDLQEARAIAGLDVRVASHDHQSLDFVLRRFDEALGHLHQAADTCTRNYEQVDAQAAQGFRQLSER